MKKKALKLDPEYLKPDKTRIIVSGLQNDFCHPRFVSRTNREQNTKTAYKVNDFVSTAAKFGFEALYFQKIHDENNLTVRQIKQIHYLQPDKIFCEAGTFGAEYFHINPPEDRGFIKNNIDLWQTKQFIDYLDQNDVDTLIFIGNEIIRCILYAVLGAYERGFCFALVKDLVSPFGFKRESKNILDIISKFYGPVVSSKEILEAMENQSLKKRYQGTPINASKVKV